MYLIDLLIGIQNLHFEFQIEGHFTFSQISKNCIHFQCQKLSFISGLQKANFEILIGHLSEIEVRIQSFIEGVFHKVAQKLNNTT